MRQELKSSQEALDVSTLLCHQLEAQLLANKASPPKPTPVRYTEFGLGTPTSLIKCPFCIKIFGPEINLRLQVAPKPKPRSKVTSILGNVDLDEDSDM